MGDAIVNERRIRNRLYRVEGQVRGIQRMLDEDRPSPEVLMQVAAARSALAAVGREIVLTDARRKRDAGEGMEELVASLEALMGSQ